jgi:hypothetical protein
MLKIFKGLAWSFAGALLLASIVSAVADYTIKDSGGVTRTVKAFVCETTKICPASVPIKSDGTEIFTSGAPAYVQFGAAPTVNLGTLNGAATAAKQPALGTAGSASTDVLTVQGIASMVPFANNLTQVNGNAALTGNGATGNGSPRVTIANDNTPPTAWPTSAKQDTTNTNLGAPGAPPCATDTGSCDINAKLSRLAENLTTLNTTAQGGTGSTGSAVPSAGVYMGLNGPSGNLRGWTAVNPSGSIYAGQVDIASWGGSTLSASNPVPVAPAAAVSGGATQYHLIAANSNNSTSVKGSAGQVYSVQLSGVGSAPAYLKFYDKATAPTCGTDTPVKVLMIPAASTAANGGGSNVTMSVGANFANGIGICVVTGIADNDNTSVAAATFNINFNYK